MPDWFYRTVSRPLLFRLSAEKSRSVALGLMGWLSRLPLGPAVIDLLGHMNPSPRLARQFAGVAIASPVGIGTVLDGAALAPAALARFGVGLVAVGPVTPQPVIATPVERCVNRQGLLLPEPPGNPGLTTLRERLSRAGALGVPLLVNVGYAPGASSDQATRDGQQVIVELASWANFFALTTLPCALNVGWQLDEWRNHVRTLRSSTRCPLLLGVPAYLSSADVDRFVAAALEEGVAGIVVTGAVREPDGRQLVGVAALDATRQAVAHWRKHYPDLPLLASSVVHEPEHALQLLDDGAQLLLVDTGLIYSGPGLPKRLNEAIEFRDFHRRSATATPPTPAARQSWFWTLMLGVSMLLGGSLAIVIAATRVVMPYDEAFVGMTRAQLAEINPRLLPFLSHDRVSLAGAMLSIGVLYTGLSLCGVRRGLHWARQAVIVSAFAGFASFFLFLGFGYFDPFHAFVTAILFQFLLLSLHAELPPAEVPQYPNLREDWRWRRSQWGQLLFIGQGVVYIVAGTVISTIGITQVFVHEDLEFMGTTVEALKAAGPQLVPLVAHDRATFGGMLIATGLTVFLASMWGYRQGYRWLWWTLLLAGIPGYAAAIGVHHAVGYTDWFHLLPAYAGSAALFLALWLSYPYLCVRDEEARRAWDTLSASTS